MKITAISDLHGNLINIKPCDTLLICGDISPLEIQKDYIQMTKWIFNTFYKWIINLPCENVIMIPGNHDFWFYNFINKQKANMKLWDKLIILINDEYNLYDSINDKWIKIYGTPNCKKFGNWAYMEGNTYLPEIYSNIPQDLDILICHDAPSIGYVGNIIESATKENPFGEDASNKWLADAIHRTTPNYVFCGHIHSGNHALMKYEIYNSIKHEMQNVNITNVSLLDENYNIKYKPLTINV